MREPAVGIRPAGPDDHATIVALLESPVSGGIQVRGAADHAALVDRMEGSWLVAEVSGTVVGAARVSMDATPRPTVYLVVVTGHARRLGVGAALLDEFRRLVREAGGSAIDAYALPGDRETKNLYERSGLTARLIVASGPA